MDTKFKAIKNAGIWGILGNIFLLIIKGLIGFASHSQSMIADAFNSASDILASLMTFIGNKIASEPEDQNHHFGHGKAEYIFSLFISITMLIVSIKLFIDSLLSLINHGTFTFSWLLIIVCLITILTKSFLYFFTKNAYKKHNSILLKSAYQDHRNDCIVTTFTLISILFGKFGIFYVDGMIGIGISLWIFISGFSIFLESYNVLMDISLDENTKTFILDLVAQHDKIKHVSNLYTVPTGYHYVVILTISVDGNMSTFDSHHLADHLEKDIENLEKVNKAIIHVNPI